MVSFFAPVPINGVVMATSRQSSEFSDSLGGSGTMLNADGKDGGERDSSKGGFDVSSQRGRSCPSRMLFATIIGVAQQQACAYAIARLGGFQVLSNRFRVKMEQDSTDSTCSCCTSAARHPGQDIQKSTTWMNGSHATNSVLVVLPSRRRSIAPSASSTVEVLVTPHRVHGWIDLRGHCNAFILYFRYRMPINEPDNAMSNILTHQSRGRSLTTPNTYLYAPSQAHKMLMDTVKRRQSMARSASPLQVEARNGTRVHSGMDDEHPRGLCPYVCS